MDNRALAMLRIGGLVLAGLLLSAKPSASSLPLCSEVQYSEESVGTAVENALDAVNAPWSYGYLDAVRLAASNLGCSLSQIFEDGFETGNLSAWNSQASEVSFSLREDARPSPFSPLAFTPGECQGRYCLGVDYCGKGDSTFGNIVVRGVSESLNYVCFVHDRCYDNNCVKGGCYFSTNAEAHACDSDMYEKCANRCGGSCNSAIDRIVCQIAERLPVKFPSLAREAVHGGDGRCDEPSCTAGTLCLRGTGGICGNPGVCATCRMGTWPWACSIPMPDLATAYRAYAYNWPLCSSSSFLYIGGNFSLICPFDPYPWCGK